MPNHIKNDPLEMCIHDFEKAANLKPQSLQNVAIALVAGGAIGLISCLLLTNHVIPQHFGLSGDIAIAYGAGALISSIAIIGILLHHSIQKKRLLEDASTDALYTALTHEIRKSSTTGQYLPNRLKWMMTHRFSEKQWIDLLHNLDKKLFKQIEKSEDENENPQNRLNQNFKNTLFDMLLRANQTQFLAVYKAEKENFSNCLVNYLDTYIKTNKVEIEPLVETSRRMDLIKANHQLTAIVSIVSAAIIGLTTYFLLSLGVLPTHFGLIGNIGSSCGISTLIAGSSILGTKLHYWTKKSKIVDKMDPKILIDMLSKDIDNNRTQSHHFKDQNRKLILIVEKYSIKQFEELLTALKSAYQNNENHCAIHVDELLNWIYNVNQEKFNEAYNTLKNGKLNDSFSEKIIALLNSKEP